jgi:poly(hydroxyalkanoate) depolymerase family esterase
MSRAVPFALIVAGLAQAATAAAAPVKVEGFGANPGNLEMYLEVPARAAASAPLVVVLHGCTQLASAIATGGFDALADEVGAFVLYPQQKTANNPARCFNWGGEYGDPANLVRGQGENQSIIEMIEKVAADHAIDPERIFIFGFSAGGGMAAVMLATWPEVFAAGVISAGIPYRCATDLNGSLSCMNLAAHPELKKEPAAWGDLVRAAAPGHRGRWPRVMIMHGSADTTVSPDDGLELIEQWTDVHGTDAEADTVETIGGHEHAIYRAGDAIVVERWAVNGMGHAVAIDSASGCGALGGYFAEAGLCAAREAFRFFAGAEDGDGDGDGGGGGDGDGDDGADSDVMDGGCATAGSGLGIGVCLALVLLAHATRRRR